MTTPHTTRFAGRLFAAAALLFQAFAVQAAEPTEAPFLWRVGGETPSYLYGTIHLPDERVTTLPDAVSAALGEADAFFAEIPLDASTQMKMAPALLLPGSQTLKELLPPELYARVDAYLKEKGLPFAAMGKLKIWAVTQTVSLADYVQKMATTPSLDQSLYQISQQQGKELGGLETVEEQLAVFEALTVDEQIEMLRMTMDELEAAGPDGPSPTEELVLTYLSGDLDRLAGVMNEHLEDGGETGAKLEKLLIDDRNRRMADRIAEKLASSPDTSYFFAVGAAHYPGEDGIIALLAARGLEIERVVEHKREPKREKVRETAPAAAGGSR